MMLRVQFLNLKQRWLLKIREWKMIRECTSTVALQNVIISGSVHGHYLIASHLCVSLGLRSRVWHHPWAGCYLETELSFLSIALAHLSLRFIARDIGPLCSFKRIWGHENKVLRITALCHSNCLLNAGGDGVMKQGLLMLKHAQ